MGRKERRRGDERRGRKVERGKKEEGGRSKGGTWREEEGGVRRED